MCKQGEPRQHSGHAPRDHRLDRLASHRRRRPRGQRRIHVVGVSGEPLEKRPAGIAHEHDINAALLLKRRLQYLAGDVGSPDVPMPEAGFLSK